LQDENIILKIKSKNNKKRYNFAKKLYAILKYQIN